MNTMLQMVLLNLFFFPLFIAVSAVVIPFLSILVALQAPFVGHRRAMRLFRLYIKAYGHVVLGLSFPWVIVKREGDSGWRGPCIFVCNHRSSSDPFLVAKLPGELVQVVNDWPFRLPVLGKFARWAGYLSVKEMPVEAFIARASHLLSQGVSIISFPEGTRSGGREMGSFHGTVFRLAQETGTPLVPVCISGNEDIPHKGSLLLKPGLIRVRQLAAVMVNDFEDMTPFKLKNHLRTLIDEELRRMEASS
jgi:1-acyl-sn-glycerol-3-phosphate acyltransferase